MNAKSSVFRGVHWDDTQKSWRVRIRKINFHRRYQTEMEAVAHYNAVARLVWPERVDKKTGDSFFGTRINNPGDGRPKNLLHYTTEGWRILIDHEFSTAVDEDIYVKGKDLHWFVKKRAVQAISTCRLLIAEPWVEFDYFNMHDWIAASKMGLPLDTLKGKVSHRDRHFLNNLFTNLVLPVAAAAA